MIIDSFERGGEEILKARDIANAVPGFPEKIIACIVEVSSRVIFK